MQQRREIDLLILITSTPSYPTVCMSSESYSTGFWSFQSHGIFYVLNGETFDHVVACCIPAVLYSNTPSLTLEDIMVIEICSRVTTFEVMLTDPRAVEGLADFYIHIRTTISNGGWPSRPGLV